MNVNMGKKTNIFNTTASTQARKLSGSNPSRTNILIVNNGSNIVYITGSQAQSYTEGIPIAANQSYSNDTTTAELWIQTSTGTSDVRVQEDGN